MKDLAKFGIVAAVVLGGVFVARRASAGTVATQQPLAVGPTGGAAISGGSGSLNSVLGAGSGGAGGTQATPPAPPPPAPAPAPLAAPPAQTVNPGDAGVTALAQGAYIQEAWAPDIKAIYLQGGAAALNAIQAQYGIDTFNAGQARAIYDLTDADVSRLRAEGILQ